MEKQVGKPGNQADQEIWTRPLSGKAKAVGSLTAQRRRKGAVNWEIWYKRKGTLRDYGCIRILTGRVLTIPYAVSVVSAGKTTHGYRYGMVSTLQSISYATINRHMCLSVLYPDLPSSTATFAVAVRGKDRYGLRFT